MIKPAIKLLGTDGNVFALVGVATKALREANLEDQANTLTTEIMRADSYDSALRIIMKYVEIT